MQAFVATRSSEVGYAIDVDVEDRDLFLTDIGNDIFNGGSVVIGNMVFAPGEIVNVELTDGE